MAAKLPKRCLLAVFSAAIPASLAGLAGSAAQGVWLVLPVASTATQGQARFLECLGVDAGFPLAGRAASAARQPPHHGKEPT
jgi:hypothetical protein